MTQIQLNRAVADATGESVHHIKQMGFTLVVVPTPARPKQGKPRSRPFVSDFHASVPASKSIGVQV